jgi:hypothetical protein
MTSRISTLHECLKAAQGVIPLSGQALEVLVGIVEALRFELPDAFPSVAVASDQTGFGKHIEVLGDCLTGYREFTAQVRD